MKGRYSLGVFVACVLWSFSFIWTKGALEYLSPVMLVLCRVSIALILVGMFSRLTGRLQRLTRRDMLIFLGLSFAEPVGYFMFETSGLQFVTPTLACVIVSTIPLFSSLMAVIINGERGSVYTWTGLLVSILGVLLVVSADGLDQISGRLLGVMLLLGAVVAAIIYTVTVQRLSKRFNSFTIVTWQNIFSFTLLVPLVFIFDGDRVIALEFSWEWGSRVLALGVLCSSVAFVLYADGIRALGVMRTSMFVNLMPGMTAVASYFIVGESLGLVKIVGIIITILGLFIGEMKKKI